MQILLIRGGTTFSHRSGFVEDLKKWTVKLEKRIRWYDNYFENMMPQHQMITPEMPLKQDAKYDEWKIFFEKHLEIMDDTIFLIGNSLGGIFLAKYLSENKIDKTIVGVIMIAPPYDNTLPGEELVGGFELGDDLSLIMENSKNVHLLFSEDDEVVPLSHMEKFKAKLPDANFQVLSGKNGHFVVTEFPEVIEIIQSLS